MNIKRRLIKSGCLVYESCVIRNQKGGILSGVRKKIDDVNKVAALEIEKCYITQDVLWGWLFGKRYVLEESGRVIIYRIGKSL